MKFVRIGINETYIELSDAELVELAYIIQRGLESLEEYNDLKCLEVHDEAYYKNTANIMRWIAQYENKKR